MTTTYGKRLRMSRLFGRAHGRLLVVPLDHSLADGPITDATTLNDLITSLADNGVDAVVLHKGRARSIDPAVLRGLSLVVHLSGSTSHAPDVNAKVLVGTVEEAVRMGADAVSVHVNIGAATESAQLEDLGRVADACDRWGMPLLAMMYARGDSIVDPTDPQTVTHLASIAVDLGADLVKTVFTGSVATMRDVVRACPAPILVAGGAVRDDERELLAYVGGVLDSGATGLAIGRNVFTARRPDKLIRELAALVHATPLPERMPALARS